MYIYIYIHICIQYLCISLVWKYLEPKVVEDAMAAMDEAQEDSQIGIVSNIIRELFNIFQAKHTLSGAEWLANKSEHECIECIAYLRKVPFSLRKQISSATQS